MPESRNSPIQTGRVGIADLNNPQITPRRPAYQKPYDVTRAVESILSSVGQITGTLAQEKRQQTAEQKRADAEAKQKQDEMDRDRAAAERSTIGTDYLAGFDPAGVEIAPGQKIGEALDAKVSKDIDHLMPETQQWLRPQLMHKLVAYKVEAQKDAVQGGAVVAGDGWAKRAGSTRLDDPKEVELLRGDYRSIHDQMIKAGLTAEQAKAPLKSAGLRAAALGDIERAKALAGMADDYGLGDDGVRWVNQAATENRQENDRYQTMLEKERKEAVANVRNDISDRFQALSQAANNPDATKRPTAAQWEQAQRDLQQMTVDSKVLDPTEKDTTRAHIKSLFAGEGSVNQLALQAIRQRVEGIRQGVPDDQVENDLKNMLLIRDLGPLPTAGGVLARELNYVATARAQAAKGARDVLYDRTERIRAAFHTISVEEDEPYITAAKMIELEDTIRLKIAENPTQSVDSIIKEAAMLAATIGKTTNVQTMEAARSARYANRATTQPASQPADPMEGRTVTMPDGGKRIRRNGQWVPL